MIREYDSTNLIEKYVILESTLIDQLGYVQISWEGTKLPYIRKILVTKITAPFYKI